jgi:hypothetical protein
MSKRNYWLLFGAAQIVGFIAPWFANVHSDPWPAAVGAVLLFPGFFVAFLHVPDPVKYALVVPINVGAWFLMRIILQLDYTGPSKDRSRDIPLG